MSDKETPIPSCGSLLKTPSGMRPVLILDDIDRMKITETRLTKLAAVIGWYQREGGRVIATSTLSKKELQAKWEKTPGAEDLVTWLTHDVTPVCVSDRMGGEA